MIRKAQRKKAKIRLGIAAPSGAGKTYTSLLIAYGLCGDWDKVVIIDSENGSGDLYEHLGGYSVLPLTAPFSPEKYIAAIKACEDAGMEVVIIDSITHEWEYILAEHSKMTGNSFTNWANFTPRHDAFIQCILQSKCHVICTVRKKTEYALTERNGKITPQKMGMKDVTRDNFDYELTTYFEMDVNHYATCSKDRTGLFPIAGIPFTPTTETGKQILDWCESGVDELGNALGNLKGCTSVDDLTMLKEGLSPTIIANAEFVAAAKKRYNDIKTAA